MKILIAFLLLLCPMLSQRRMENVYLSAFGQRPNEVFTVHGGGDTDIITIGFYDSLQEFA